jgi:radical SAM enzyme (rSAM/lipoprotein system)
MSTLISTRKKIAFELFRIFRKNTTKIHKLSYFFWECTLRCNLNCLHCGSDCNQQSAPKDMPIADFLKVIDSILQYINPNTTMVVITGGEPLLREDLGICGTELYKRGFPWGMVTNGYFLTKERLESLLNSGLKAITISLDGFEDSHNWLRNNKSSYKNAISAIKMLPKITNIEYDIVTCVNKKNIDELIQIKEFLIEIGIKDWRVSTIFPIGRAKENNDLNLSSKQFKQVFDFIKDTRKENRIRVNYGCEGFLGGYEGEVRDNFFFCTAGINVASILVDGSISACPNLRGNFIQGNIYKDDFLDIWNNRYKEYRDKSWAKTDECACCKYFRYCEGNGMHLRDEKSKKLLLCHLDKLKKGECTCP